jgi:energy-coupling factor transport system ATP-binding protein
VSLTLRGIEHVHDHGRPWATRALEGVSMTVERGALTAVLGASGCGKSTLLRIAAGLLQPTSGDVDVDGCSLYGREGADARRRVGLVFQRPESQLFADTVVDDVAFGPTNLGMGRDEAVAAARQALSAVGLDPESFGGRSPFHLSGGEARRAAIAGVLAMDPEYLLLDEPTAGLDRDGREAVFAAIASARDGAGVVIVSHDPDEALQIADDVLLLVEGTAVYAGPVAELLDQPTPLTEADLPVPEVLRVSVMLRSRGVAVPRTRTIDPLHEADAVADALGGQR